MKALTIAAVLAVSFPVSALAQSKTVAEPLPRPNWVIAKTAVESTIRPSLFDPDAAKIDWISGFEWGYAKPVIGKRTWGWVACISLNAKNRLGGYVGAAQYWVQYSPDGKVAWGPVDGVFSQCDKPGKVALQPELIGVATSGVASVADELAKLAELRDRGIINQTEFETQKTKLLQP